MKLYTEEQVKKIATQVLGFGYYDEPNNLIELPSYDQIKYTAKNADKSKCKHFRREQTIEQVYDSFEEGFIFGVKWIIEQIKQQNNGN